jgi:hypothetical protein
MYLYTIHMPPEFPSSWIFGFKDAPAIPADFFGIGSDPWAGTISCVGIPLNSKGPTGTADMIVTQEAIEWIPNPIKAYGPREIPREFRLRCDMKQLSERVPTPIIVTYNGGKREEKWDTLVKIAKNHPGGGHIDITWINANGNGGLCDIEIAVKVDFIFTHTVADGQKKQVVLTSGVEWLSETNHNFVRWPSARALHTFNVVPGANGKFIPAMMDLGGETQAKAGCSKNERVIHSFVLAPSVEPPTPGVSTEIKEFPVRRE